MNAASRKAFAITGKDTGSPFLRFLAEGRAGEDLASFEVAAASLGIDEEIDAVSLVDWYRQLNHGYPFLDYSKEETRAIDANLMGAYAAADHAPPIVTDRDSLYRVLAPGRIEGGSSKPQPLSEQLIAGLLRASAGITHLRQLSHSMTTLRTSPSGGARHPTDLGVQLGSAWPADLTGSWWYDPLEHRLTRAPHDHVADLSGVAPAAIVFIISSHVRRAMWRYRDVRAFRPVVIDAGHVVETLLSVIAYAGWTGWWQAAPRLVEAAGEFDPVFGYVVAMPDATRPVLPMDTFTTPRGESNGELRTNPLISLTVTRKAVIGENHLRRNARLTLTPTMIDTLAYATPSSRRNRPSSPGLTRARYGLTETEFDALLDAGFLLCDAKGDPLWKLMRTWSENDWFLSLLVHACEVAGASEVQPPLAGPIALYPPSLPCALDLRRTSRALTALPVPEPQAERLLTSLATANRGIRIILSTRQHLGSLQSGTYNVRDGSYELMTVAVPSEEDVVAAAIGQPWARQFSCIVWIVPIPSSEPGAWEASLIECGRVAQRLTLAICDEPRIGIFQSPALIDEMLGALLAGPAPIDGAYMVGVGATEPLKEDATLPRRFQPSSLFVACRSTPS